MLILGEGGANMLILGGGGAVPPLGLTTGKS